MESSYVSAGSVVVIYDSAGVRVVETRAPVWGEGGEWAVAAVPQLQIGARDGAPPYLFTRIAGATRATDGRIVVVEGRTREIRVFDSGGAHIVSFGGAGEGPGQFQSPPEVATGASDTLVAYDAVARRYSWFRLSGEFIRDETLAMPAGVTEIGVPVWRGILEQGALLIASALPSPNQAFVDPSVAVAVRPVPGIMSRSDIALNVVRGNPAQVFQIGKFPSDEGGIVDGRPSMSVTNPYYWKAYWAIGGAPWGIHVTNPGRREILTFDLEGSLRRVIRHVTPLMPLTADMVASARAEVRERAAERGIDPRATLALFDEIQFPDSIPPYASLQWDRDGNLWALAFEMENAASEGQDMEFHIFDSIGVFLGQISIPREVARFAGTWGFEEV